MKRFLKVAGLVLGGLLALIIVVFTAFFVRVELKRSSKIETHVTSIELPTDAASLAEGKRLLQVKACADCHGADMGGRMFIDEAPIGQLAGSNLTPGEGSRTKNFTSEDWIRAIRYAVDPTGRPLIAMPAGDFNGMSDEELGRVIAYLKTVPAVDRPSPAPVIGPVARVLYNLGQMPLMFPFEEVDLNSKAPTSVKPEVSVEYGRYLSMACTGCHGPGFGGGRIPGTPPVWPEAKNITPGGAMAKWSRDEFKKVLTEGVTPEGHQIDSQFMPWKSMQAMNDLEIDALYMFLKQVPAKEFGTR